VALTLIMSEKICGTWDDSYGWVNKCRFLSEGGGCIRFNVTLGVGEVRRHGDALRYDYLRYVLCGMELNNAV